MRVCFPAVRAALTELFALRTHGGYIFSLSMLEVTPAGVRDLLPATALAEAGVPADHVSSTEFDRTAVNEVFMAERHQAFTLLHQVRLLADKFQRKQKSVCLCMTRTLTCACLPPPGSWCSQPAVA